MVRFLKSSFPGFIMQYHTGIHGLVQHNTWATNAILTPMQKVTTNIRIQVVIGEQWNDDIINKLKKISKATIAMKKLGLTMLRCWFPDWSLETILALQAFNLSRREGTFCSGTIYRNLIGDRLIGNCFWSSWITSSACISQKTSAENCGLELIVIRI